MMKSVAHRCLYFIAKIRNNSLYQCIKRELNLGFKFFMLRIFVIDSTKR